MRNAKQKPPGKGVSPELLELVLAWLRKAYGSRPLDEHMVWELSYHLGGLEREYLKPDPTESAVTKERNGRLWSDPQ